MPPRRRDENKGLPARWQFTHGAYYYLVKPGLEHLWDGRRKFRLGKTLPEAYRAYSERIGYSEKVNTVGQLLDRYAIEVVPNKAPKSRAENSRHITRLRAVFGHMGLTDIRPQHCYQLMDKSAAKVSAKRALEVLSHAYTKAVSWGYIDRHPLMGQIRFDGIHKPRDRYVEDWEVLECLSLGSRRRRGSVLAIQAYIRLKLLTGMARSDLLRLQPGKHFRDDGIHVQRHKTGKRTVYEWTAERRQAVDDAIAARPVDISPFLFCNKRGRGYFNESTGTCNGFDSMWQRFMDRVLEETKVMDRFTEHDLRAKAGSDADSLEKARALLQHADARTTHRVYRRRPERV